MKILFDQGTPAPLRNELKDHVVITAYEAGYDRLSNGELIGAVESNFDLLITTDKNLRYQQNLTERRLAIVVLPTTSWPRIRNHIPAIVEAVTAIKPSEYREISF